MQVNSKWANIDNGGIKKARKAQNIAFGPEPPLGYYQVLICQVREGSVLLIMSQVSGNLDYPEHNNKDKGETISHAKPFLFITNCENEMLKSNSVYKVVNSYKVY